MYNAFKIVAAIVLVWIALSMCIDKILAPVSEPSVSSDDGIAGRYHLRNRTTRFFSRCT